jgi:hypothetical protein
MSDLEERLRSAFSEIERSTRPSQGFLERVRLRAEQRRRRRMAAAAAAAFLAVFVGAVGVPHWRTAQREVTVVVADGGADGQRVPTPAEPVPPVLPDEARARLAAMCATSVPEVQAAQVVFETSAGYSAVITIVSTAATEADRVLAALIGEGIAPAELSVFRTQLKAAEAHLAAASESVMADQFAGAAEEIEAARASYWAIADALTLWGIEECNVVH